MNGPTDASTRLRRLRRIAAVVCAVAGVGGFSLGWQGASLRQASGGASPLLQAGRLPGQ